MSYTALQLNDIYHFVGAILFMNVFIFPELPMYWGRNGSSMQSLNIVNAISYSRFSSIRDALHVED